MKSNMNDSNMIHLRAMEPEDLDMLYRIENDAELWDVGVTNVPYSRYLLHEYISNATGNIYTDGQVRLMIEDCEGRVVGIADLTDFDGRHCRAEIGIVIEKPHRGKGYALAALQQMAAYAQRVLHLHQLYACVDVNNNVALSLFRKAGFQQTAQLTDWLYDGKDYHPAVLMQYMLT